MHRKRSDTAVLRENSLSLSHRLDTDMDAYWAAKEKAKAEKAAEAAAPAEGEAEAAAATS